jgi:hypothetical protein
LIQTSAGRVSDREAVKLFKPTYHTLTNPKEGLPTILMVSPLEIDAGIENTSDAGKPD